jgi:hypothetical protein
MVCHLNQESVPKNKLHHEIATKFKEVILLKVMQKSKTTKAPKMVLLFINIISTSIFFADF